MKDRKVAARYARALLEALPNQQEAEKTDEFLTALGNAMDESDDFRALMLDPAVPSGVRREVLVALADQHGASEHLKNFLQILVKNKRTGSIASIATVFHEEREAAAGIVPAEITTAVALTEDMTTRVRAALERATGKKIRLTSTIDPALLGGAVTRLGSTVLDGSLRSQLQQLRTKMMQE
jgi:F-type H+-transporting ATPase subunit delta